MKRIWRKLSRIFFILGLCMLAIYILNEISSETIGRIAYYPDESYGRSWEYVAYQKKLLFGLHKALERKSESDLLIALNHFPVVDERVDEIIDSTLLSWQNFDLIISGHYHGGQIRVPILGAVFVPESWYRSGFFPPQDRVRRLWEYYNTKHYVSTGLGSSNAVSFLNFRLFNSPEINLLTFTGG
ncbi:metallophosphoesterase [Ornithinibacillus sp. BX22]|uniref:Metallophosphoesterase n=2 Tax=Ornithinibacillus TaxID=484508 RepID=A0A923RJI7_9BACI|nr:MULTISPECIES: metallophosphoesterase [Ornithinibacillus]MBC5638001.1 metallophosphoesterase [Ornithinibacillus hominis]MBS3681889.1 metallophosphoesterase [Ornithinibacillus massiliensis]